MARVCQIIDSFVATLGAPLTGALHHEKMQHPLPDTVNRCSDAGIPVKHGHSRTDIIQL